MTAALMHGPVWGQHGASMGPAWCRRDYSFEVILLGLINKTVYGNISLDLVESKRMWRRLLRHIHKTHAFILYIDSINIFGVMEPIRFKNIDILYYLY